MSQTKYPMPDDLKSQCISLVRGYDRRVKLYHERRNAIIYSSAPPNVITSMGADGKEIGEFAGRGNNVSNPVYSKVCELEKLEHLYDTQSMRAVEQAKLLIGIDWDEEQRQKLVRAIWNSCKDGHNFKLEYYNLPIGSNNFYERRRGFLWHIAKNMGFL